MCYFKTAVLTAVYNGFLIVGDSHDDMGPYANGIVFLLRSPRRILLWPSGLRVGCSSEHQTAVGGPKGHINIRILHIKVFGIPLVLGLGTRM